MNVSKTTWSAALKGMILMITILQSCHVASICFKQYDSFSQYSAYQKQKHRAVALKNLNSTIFPAHFNETGCEFYTNELNFYRAPFNLIPVLPDQIPGLVNVIHNIHIYVFYLQWSFFAYTFDELEYLFIHFKFVGGK